MTYDEILSHLQHVRRSGDANATARCPGHEDSNNSLSVTQASDGKTLLHCFTGCSVEQILDAAGLQKSDLFRDRTDRRLLSRVTVADIAQAKALPVDFLKYHGWRDDDGKVLIPYRDETGKETARPHVRTALRAVDGSHWSGPRGGQLITYGEWRIEEFRKGGRLAICEGETDTLTLWHANKPAIGVPGATMIKTLRPELLRGFSNVVVFQDRDKKDGAGERFARAAATVALVAGVSSVRIVLPPEGCKDLNDWHRRDPARFVGELQTAVAQAALYQPSPSEVAASAATPADDPAALQFTALRDLLAEPDEAVEWIVEDRIPRGSLCLLAGKPKAGKSTLARVGALQVARGGEWLGWPCTSGPVWYLAFEDKRSEIRKHFRKMGATGTDPVRFFFPQRTDDLLRRLQALAEAERPFLIIVDTLQRLIGARDLNDYAEVTTKLTPLLTLARETGAAVLLVHHAGKGDRAGIDSPLGSTALAGSVDNILICTRTDRYRLLSSIQRVGPDLDQTVLQLDEETGHLALGGARHDADVSVMKAAMVDALTTNGDPLAEKDLEKLVEGRGRVKRDALRALVGDGKVTRDGRGKRGDPYVYSISPTLVPIPMRERETEKPKTVKTSDEQGSDSRSHEMNLLDDERESRERETGQVGGASRARVRF